MNEELVIKIMCEARDYTNANPAAMVEAKIWNTVYNQKFAELIVRECAYIPIDMWDKAELNADVAVKIEDRIKQYFGVE